MFRRILSTAPRAPPSLQQIRQNTQAVPEPRGLPILGTLPELLVSGASTHLHKYIDKRHAQLGSIFREQIGPVKAVFVADPIHQRQVYSCEGRHPKHVIPDSWVLYNKEKKCRRGILFMEDEEWHNYRRILNSVLLKDIDENMLETCFRSISKKLVDEWSSKDKVKELNSFSYSWAVEAMISILIGNADHPEFIKMKSEINKFGKNVNQIFVETSRLQLFPAELTRNLRLPVWRRFENAVTQALNNAQILLEKSMPISRECNGILQKMNDANIEPDALQRIAVDLILGAGDTSANTFQWMLYLLCRNQKYQELVYDELKTQSQCSKDYENSYLKAILRETLRLYPVAPFVTRYMPQDTEIGGYNIEAGTLVILSLYTSSRDPNNFQEPNKFWPERWFRVAGKYQGVNNPSGSLPFAFGARSCVGRKIAEIMLKISISEIIQRFQFELVNDGEIDMILKMLSVPSKPIELKISKRS